MAEEIMFKGLSVTADKRRFSKSFGDKGGNFTIEIPLPFQKAHIISGTARVLGGQSIESIGKEGYEYVRMCVTLNSVIIDNPPWWKNADTCPDDDFLNELWRWYLDCEEEFATRLKREVKASTLEKS